MKVYVVINWDKQWGKIEGIYTTKKAAHRKLSRLTVTDFSILKFPLKGLFKFEKPHKFGDVLLGIKRNE